MTHMQFYSVTRADNGLMMMAGLVMYYFVSE